MDVSFFQNKAPNSGSGGSCSTGEASDMPPAVSVLADQAMAALVVLSFPELQLRHLELMQLPLAVKYLPGFLGFR